MTLHPFICIEGIDGTGKSTVARRVAELLNGIYYKTPPEPFASIRKTVDRVRDPYARAMYYVASVAYAASEIRCLREIAPVVCDRYIYSTVAYHAVLSPDVGTLLQSLPFDPPDESFVLIAEEAVRLKRLSDREMDGERVPLNRDYDGGFLAKVEEKFLTLGLVVIDTTNLTSNDVAAQIVSRMLVTTEMHHETTDGLE